MGELEQQLCTTLLFHPEAIAVVADKLKPEAFLETKHRYIYNSALRLYQADIEVSLITVYDDLAYHKLLDEVGGQPGLAYIAGLLPSHNPQRSPKS
uniref:DnaB-like helicase N-terminal domain-containing protein n=1 Tax=Desertifilum tharense IPPAS B-1220 TaxID=1781255 RepID=A0ACD5H2J3_9CYAN